LFTKNVKTEGMANKSSYLERQEEVPKRSLCDINFAIFVTIISIKCFLRQCAADVVPCDDHDAGDGPQLHEHDPHPVLDGALMMVPDPNPQGSPSLLPGIIHQSCRHIVLDPSPYIAPCDPNKEL
jgi:hypothetical protein